MPHLTAVPEGEGVAFADNGRGDLPILTAITVIIATTALTVHTRARLSDDDGPMWEIEPPPIRNKPRNPLRKYAQRNTRQLPMGRSPSASGT